MTDLSDTPLDELIQMYRENAAEHGRGTNVRNHILTNDAYFHLSEVFRELRRRNGEALMHLLPLLADDDVWVKLWTAAHALTFAPDKGEEVLAALAASEDVAGFEAEMTLEMWRKGELEFP